MDVKLRRERQREWQKLNRERNIEKTRMWARQYYQDNKDRYKKYRREHKDILSAQNRKSRNKMKKTLIKGYGGKCECCDTPEIEFLTIHHRFEDGKAERQAGLRGYKFYKWLIECGFPKDRYALLCWNCNVAIENWGYCPHRPQHS